MVINKVVVAWPDFKGQLFKGSRGLCYADKAAVKIVLPLLGKSSWCERVLYSEVLQISSCLWSYKKRGNCNQWLNTTNLQAFFLSCNIHYDKFIKFQTLVLSFVIIQIVSYFNLMYCAQKPKPPMGYSQWKFLFRYSLSIWTRISTVLLNAHT